MKPTLALTAALAAALALSACNRDQAAETSAESGVGSNPASNTVQDAVGAAVGQTSAATLGANTVGGYVANAAIADMYEIAASKVALERSKNAEIKKAAQMIITDHTKSSTELKTALSGAGVGADVTIPPEMDERRKGMVDNLRQAPADGFDRVYLGQQTAAHQESLTLHRGFAENGDNAALKAHAAKTAPVIEKHLQHVRGLEGGQR
jgi:putative membrane protein